MTDHPTIIYYDALAPPWVRVIVERLDLVLANQEKIMITLDQILADVTDEGTQIKSLSTLMAGIKQQLADALAGVTITPAVQAKIDAVFAGVEANKAEVVAAINAPMPPPTPTP